MLFKIIRSCTNLKVSETAYQFSGTADVTFPYHREENLRYNPCARRSMNLRFCRSLLAVLSRGLRCRAVCGPAKGKATGWGDWARISPSIRSTSGAFRPKARSRLERGSAAASRQVSRPYVTATTQSAPLKGGPWSPSKPTYCRILPPVRSAVCGQSEPHFPILLTTHSFFYFWADPGSTSIQPLVLQHFLGVLPSPRALGRPARTLS
jgi:hypothetical protein